jgi:hypothetical protein
MRYLCLNKKYCNDDIKTKVDRPLYSKIISLINVYFHTDMKKDGSHYVLVAFTDPNAKSTGGGGSGEAVPFTSPEDLMKNLPKVMSNMFGKGAGGGDSSTFKITMKEYEDMAIKIGDKVMIEIKEANNNGV